MRVGWSQLERHACGWFKIGRITNRFQLRVNQTDSDRNAGKQSVLELITRMPLKAGENARLQDAIELSCCCL